MQYKTNKKYFKAFTLVELIIVITILAVLATIAFVSFSSYTASSRDTKRIVTIENISKGLNIFQTQTGKYPNIDNQSSTGIINSDILSFVGEVGDNVSKLINISPTPKDPVSGNNFKYATSFDNKYFQVAGTQEKPVAEKSIIDQTYANTRQAKVLGNYNGLLKKDNKLYNLPSLIYTGSGYLISNDTYFIVDKGQNIPYKITATDEDNSLTTDIILSQLTGTSSVTLTGVTLPSTVGELKTNIDSVVQVLGYPGDKIGQESFGTPYFVANITSSSSSSSGGPTPTIIPTIIQTDGNFNLFSNGTVKCTGASVGHTGVLNGITYTAVSNQNLQDKKESNDTNFYETACTSLVTNMSYVFYSSDINPDISSWDVSNVTDMSYMFACLAGEVCLFSSFNPDISNWDVSKVTNMGYMFSGANSFNQPLNSWDVSKVTNMRYMFSDTDSFNQALDSWDVSNVTDMFGMFYFSPYNQPLNNWDVSSVTTMRWMFGFTNTFNQPLNNWDVSNVVDITYMFHNAAKFNQNISNWCVTKIGFGSPSYFDTNTNDWNPKVGRQPVWGTCPGG